MNTGEGHVYPTAGLPNATESTGCVRLVMDGRHFGSLAGVNLRPLEVPRTVVVM